MIILEPELDVVDELLARARAIDPLAWAERDRLERERGVNPDRMDQEPRNAAERRWRDRRMHSIALAVDEDLGWSAPEMLDLVQH